MKGGEVGRVLKLWMFALFPNSTRAYDLYCLTQLLALAKSHVSSMLDGWKKDDEVLLLGVDNKTYLLR